MSAVELVPTADVDPSTVTSDAFEIPCRRAEKAMCATPAVWAVWLVDHDICCNPPTPAHETPIFMCEPCVQRWRDRGLICPWCGKNAGTFAELVTRLDRIKP